MEIEKLSIADLISIASHLTEKYKKLKDKLLVSKSGSAEFDNALTEFNQLKRTHGRVIYEIDERLKKSGIMDYNPYGNK